MKRLALSLCVGFIAFWFIACDKSEVSSKQDSSKVIESQSIDSHTKPLGEVSTESTQTDSTNVESSQADSQSVDSQVQQSQVIESHQYHPQNRDELVKLVRDESINLSDIDTSKITNMAWIFSSITKKSCESIKNNIDEWIDLKSCINTAGNRKNFQGIETWNVSNVATMEGMFAWSESQFNENISSWNVSKVTNMGYMFAGTLAFNQPLDKWNISNVKNMAYMFGESNSFLQNLDSWNVQNVKNMKFMFAQSKIEIESLKFEGKNMFPKWYKSKE
ncbi:hypothetical protein CQA53_09830 [Helicobacter didelphidarum]|uniref:BspA family leucine-rich repeat surface protein n=1 Tax=Helicobacter didelphidarum TaxID=2040648 RepID=A0A3D8I9D2_9HELI|nr:BspA family leucine-rich repeat surface protein [Helicobacter didelphidarum]RDU61728.1 hypothetical protein CQA53_09830 [Helicobacter didelphidarum]